MTGHGQERSLAAHLAAGGDPLDLWGVGEGALLVSALVDVTLTRPQNRPQVAGGLRRMATDGVSAAVEAAAAFVGVDDPRTHLQATARRAVWEAELYDDPALVEQVVARLPETLQHSYRWQAEVASRPYRLNVEPIHQPRGWWACDSCGSQHDDGAEGMTVRARPGWSDLGVDALVYCAECVTMAAEALA